MTVAPAAVEATRPVFWHFPAWLQAVWYLLAVASVAVFAYGAIRPLAKYRRGKGGAWPPCPWRQMSGRLWSGLRLAMSHRTIARRDRTAGLGHAAIFYGFLVLFAGTVVLGFDTDLTEPIFGWGYFHGDFYLVYKEVLNLFGTVLIAGLLVMMVRRARRPFDRSIYRRGDWAFVLILLTIALTGFLLEGVRIAMDAPGYSVTQFGGWVVAQALSGLPESILAGARHGLWWFHGLLAIVFVASIPYTKASHMLTSYLSLSLRDPLAGKRLQPAPVAEGESVGYATLEDFSPLHLLQLDACTNCGKCHEVCPANASGRPLSPRDVILELREQSNHAFAGVGGVLGGLLRDDDVGGSGFGQPVVGDDAVRTETIWSCLQCNACVEICPVGIEQAPIINQLRRAQVDNGEIDADLQATLRRIHKSGNSFGEKPRRRARWAEGLDFKIKDARSEAVDVLWFVGDFASFDPRSQDVSRSLARLLHDAGVDFGILYEEERNAGNDVRRIGEEGLFESLAEHNSQALIGCEFQRIVTSDPHSLNTLRNEYPQLGVEWTVIHHTELLLELIEAGDLELRDHLTHRVTYHDPCHLGRFNGEYDNPRKILEVLGCTLVEMPRNRDNSFCCGAGGGQIWMNDRGGGERPSENRIKEAVELDRVDYFVVSCPKDVTMYEDAIKTTGNAQQIELREITELIEEAVASPVGAAGVAR
jgi:Fe-S oxidoreductase/nitrate reductase gamma subunit